MALVEVAEKNFPDSTEVKVDTQHILRYVNVYFGEELPMLDVIMKNALYELINFVILPAHDQQKGANTELCVKIQK